MSRPSTPQCQPVIMVWIAISWESDTARSRSFRVLIVLSVSASSTTAVRFWPLIHRIPHWSLSYDPIIHCPRMTQWRFLVAIKSHGSQRTNALRPFMKHIYSMLYFYPFFLCKCCVVFSLCSLCLKCRIHYLTLTSQALLDIIRVLVNV